MFDFVKYYKHTRVLDAFNSGLLETKNRQYATELAALSVQFTP